MKALLRVMRIAVIVLLCLLLLANLWLLAARLIFHKELPKLFGYAQAIVISGSMEPRFSAGDMLIFREYAHYGEQDIVIFRQNGAYVTHRIVGRSENGFITRGDANNTEDKEILDPAQIEGKMVAVIPGIGGVLSFLKTPLGLLVLILTGLLLIEGPYIADRYRERKVKK